MYLAKSADKWYVAPPWFQALLNVALRLPSDGFNPACAISFTEYPTRGLEGEKGGWKRLLAVSTRLHRVTDDG